MSLAFWDSFDRPDGVLGNGWISDAGTHSILSGYARATVAGKLHNLSQPVGDDCAQRAVLQPPVSGSKLFYFHFREDELNENSISVNCTFTTTGATFAIVEQIANTGYTLASRTYPFTWGDVIDVQVAVVGYSVYVWCDGYEVLATAVTSVLFNGQAAITIGSTSFFLDEYQLMDLGGEAFQVEAVPYTGQDGWYNLTLHNVGRPWTPGTPGSPTFIALTGNIESQEVIDVDTAELLYSAPTLSGIAGIIDPLNERQYRFGITSDGLMPEGEGATGGVTEEQATILSDLGDWLLDYQQQVDSVPRSLFMQMGDLVIATSSGTGGNSDMLRNTLLAILDETDGIAASKNIIDLLYALLDSTTTQGGYTLSSVQEALRGSGTRDLTQVYNAIAALGDPPGTDLDAILAELAAIRTASLWTLEHVRQWILDIPAGSNADVLQELALIRTANNWSLGHIMDAITAIAIPDYQTELDTLDQKVTAIPTNPIVSLQPVLDAITAVRGAGNPDLAALLTAINLRPTNPITSLQAVLDAISAVRGSGNPDLAAILTAINAIEAGTGTPGAPVWPGLANVTFGAPVALSTGLTITTPMHGVVVNLTSVPAENDRYLFDTEASWVHIGALAFADDNDAFEGFQPFSFGKHILTPTRLVRAERVVIRSALGVQGTVTPWTINAPA
jgi:hypothetical protein